MELYFFIIPCKVYTFYVLFINVFPTQIHKNAASQDLVIALIFTCLSLIQLGLFFL